MQKKQSRSPLSWSAVIGAMSVFMTPCWVHAQAESDSAVTQESKGKLSAAELDQLIGKIALYPDSLIANILPVLEDRDRCEAAGGSDQPWLVVRRSRRLRNSTTNHASILAHRGLPDPAAALPHTEPRSSASCRSFLMGLLADQAYLRQSR